MSDLFGIYSNNFISRTDAIGLFVGWAIGNYHIKGMDLVIFSSQFPLGIDDHSGVVWSCIIGIYFINTAAVKPYLIFFGQF